MTIILNGTTGITNDGGYTGDGVVFANTTPANTLVTDTSGNVMIGTTTQISKLTIAGGVALSGGAGFGNAFYPYYNSATSYNAVSSDSNGNMTFITGVSSPAVRATIDNNGILLINSTATLYGNEKFSVKGGTANATAVMAAGNTTGIGQLIFLNSSNGLAGYIQFSGSTTSYVTSSDYRLKDDIQPMTGALAKVALLKPVTYKWKADGTDGQGFIAHELQAVVPDCVVGEKDEVTAEGKPQYQGIDTSFLVATLTAAIQELKAIVDAQGAEIAALKGTQP
jgi:hypothetical protein